MAYTTERIDHASLAAAVVGLLSFRLEGILSGPAGIHLDFVRSAEPSADEPEASIFHGGSIRYRNRAGEVLEYLSPLTESEAEQLRLLLLHQRLTRVSVTRKENWLRLEFDGAAVLSLFCDVDRGENTAFWGLYPRGRQVWYSVFQDSIKKMTEEGERSG